MTLGAGFTVAQVMARGGKACWRCSVCQGQGPVDLVAVAAALGPDATLGNRRPRCRVPGCPGRVRFLDANSVWPLPLDTITDADDAWWTFDDQERARLTALGWRVHMGKWVAPDPVTPPSPATPPPSATPTTRPSGR